jgi:hypothetical protein
MSVMLSGIQITSGFTITGIGDDQCTVTFDNAPISGTPILLYRDVALERDTDYQKNGDFLSTVVNADFDRIWMALQDIGGMSARGLHFPLTEYGLKSELPAAATRAAKALIFDASGNATVSAEPFQEGSAIVDQARDVAEQLIAGIQMPTFQSFAPTLLKDGIDYTSGASTSVTLPVTANPKVISGVFFDGVFQSTSQWSLGIDNITLSFNGAIPSGIGEVSVMYFSPSMLGTFFQDGFGVIGRTLQAKMRDVISLTDFAGIDPTGTHDSSAGIQAAINAVQALPWGGELHVPKGTYIINSPVSIVKDTKTFRLTGEGATSIFKAGATLPAGPMFNLGEGSSPAGGSDCVISKCMIQPGAGTQTTGFACLNMNGIRFDDVQFGAVQNAITLNACYAVRLNNCQWVNTTQWGVYSYTSAHNIILDSCKGFGVGGTTGIMLRIDGATNNIVLQNCDFEQCSVIYSLAAGSTSIRVIGCYIEYTVNVEFFHQGLCYGLTVEDCWIALRTSSTGYLNLIGCKFRSNTIYNMTCRFDPATCDNVFTDSNILSGTGALTGRFLRTNAASAFFDGNSATLAGATVMGCNVTWLSSGRVRVTPDFSFSFSNYMLQVGGIGVSNGTNWCVPGIVAVAGDGSYIDVGAIVTGDGAGAVPEMHLSLLITKVR